MPSLSPRPAQAPLGVTISTPSFQGSEAYYSNDDIEILYSVVSRAQEILNNLPEGERLATNALFSAYDEVLPLYGIDPEEDHHISRLIFRIGGERGVGSLLDRCQDVLLRMGIELELDSDSLTDTSMFSSHRRPDNADTHNTGPIDASFRNHPDDPTDSEGFGIGVRDLGSNISPAPGNSLYTAARLQRGTEDFAQLNQPSITSELPDAKSEVLRPHSAIRNVPDNGLAFVVETETLPKVANNMDIIMDGTHEPRRHPVRTRTSLAHHTPAYPFLDSSTAQNSRLEVSSANHVRQYLKHHEDGIQSEILRGDKPESHRSQVHQLQFDIDSLQSEDSSQRLRRRASRAWVLLQLTRAVSHWAVFSDEKLERAAIARRHILRVRYFSSWVTDAIEGKRAQRQKALHKYVGAWSGLSRKTTAVAQGQCKKHRQRLAQRVLGKWTLRSSDTHVCIPRSIVSRMTRKQIQHWRSQCHGIKSMVHQANTALYLRTIAKLQTLQSWEATCYMQVAGRFQRCVYIFEALRLWTLVVRGRQLQDELRSRSFRTLLRHWHSLRQDEGRERKQLAHQSCLGVSKTPQAGARRFHYQLSSLEVLKTWRHTALAANTANYSALAHSARRRTHRALVCWYAARDGGLELAQWAYRAQEYLGYTTMLQAWKQVVPRWSSSVQKAYIQCRWRHKALIARKKLLQWKTAMRHLNVVVYVTRSTVLWVGTNRLSKTLGAWQQQCRLQAALESPAYMHDVWLNEWVVSVEGLRLVEREASGAWALSLKSKIWSKWRSVSVQLHSQLYIVMDVTEKNTRKSVRRILMHWKAEDEALHAPVPISLTGSSYGISRGSRVQDSLLWSRTRSGRTATSSLLGSQTWPRDTEEDDAGQPASEADEMQDMVSTPTRRIGFEALARLPTTTPLAPLSTPFERELRGRYIDSARTSQVNRSGHLSIRGTPRLSTIEARRIAEQRRRRRPI